MSVQEGPTPDKAFAIETDLTPQRLEELVDQETIDQLKEKVASSPGLEAIYRRFCQLRTQLHTLGLKLSPLNVHRSALKKILAVQQQKNLSNPQRSDIRRWVNQLATAREPVIPDQAALTDYDLKGADFSWVIDPLDLQDAERRLHELEIIQFATLHAAEKLLRTIQAQLGEKGDDEAFDKEEEDFSE